MKNSIKLQREKNKKMVSIFTPTYNRRRFIPNIICCVLAQDYKAGEIEWVILDDGEDKIGDLVKHLKFVKYISYDKKLPLGEKRNRGHEHCRGEFIIYMDDDDYYPPERVSHAVQMLEWSPDKFIAGSTVMPMHFIEEKKTVSVGPYGPNHATAGTFAFRRKLLDFCKYDRQSIMSEEKYFLKNYTIPMVQLNPAFTIIVMCHDKNTFDKRKMVDTNMLREIEMDIEQVTSAVQGYII